MIELSGDAQRLFSEYCEEAKALLTLDRIAALEAELPQIKQLDNAAIASRLAWCLIVQRRGGNSHHQKRQKNRELSLDKLTKTTKVLRDAQKMLKTLLRKQENDTPPVIESMEDYYVDTLFDDAMPEGSWVDLGEADTVQKLIAQVGADLDRVLGVCRITTNALKSSPKRSGNIDVEGSALFRCAALLWLDCAGRPPTSRAGPFCRFLEALRNVLPEDCRPAPSSSETVRDRLRKFNNARG